MLRKFQPAALMLAVFLAASPALAATISYGNLSGASVDFLSISESATTDPVPLYGTPGVSGDSLIFGPGSFTSAASGVAADTTSGRISVTLQAKPGQLLGKIVITESGDYSLFGGLAAIGSPTATAQVSGLLTVTPLVPVGAPQSASTVVSPIQPLFVVGGGNASGSWSGSAVIDLKGLNVTRAQLVLNNVLQTSTSSGADARIRKTALTITVPEPTTALLMAVGIAGLLAIGPRRS